MKTHRIKKRDNKTKKIRGGGMFDWMSNLVTKGNTVLKQGNESFATNNKKITQGVNDAFNKGAQLFKDDPSIIKGKTLPEFMKKDQMRINDLKPTDNGNKIIQNSCDFTDKQSIIDKYIPSLHELQNKNNKIIITIMPYCSEKIKEGDNIIVGNIAKMVDKVNASEVDKEIVDALTTKLNVNFNTTNVTDENGKYKSTYNVEKFITFLDGFVEHDLNLFNLNLFIVSHSGFMQKMLKKITNIEKYQIDNLDIFQYGYVDGKIKYIIVRKWKNNYNIAFIVDITDGIVKIIKDNFETIVDNIISSKTIQIWVFLIRHCKGCHNTEVGLTAKISRTFSDFSTGYLENALCLVDTPAEMQNVGIPLFEILKKFSKNPENTLTGSYIFGSSVILRAILTIIMQVRVILSIETLESTKSPSNTNIVPVSETQESTNSPSITNIVPVLDTQESTNSPSNTNIVPVSEPNINSKMPLTKEESEKAFNLNANLNLNKDAKSTQVTKNVTHQLEPIQSQPIQPQKSSSWFQTGTNWFKTPDKTPDKTMGGKIQKRKTKKYKKPKTSKKLKPK